MYDYQLRDVTSDEVFVRIDASTHLDYWHSKFPNLEFFELARRALPMVPRASDAKRGYGSDPWWQNLFDEFIVDGRTGNGVHAKYEFSEVLYSTSISCPPNVDGEMNIKVQGKLEAKLDWGLSLIGLLHDTSFEESYAFFAFRGASVNLIPTIEGSAQISMETIELKLLEDFAPWGANFNLKGLVTVGPFMDVTARIDAIATLSGKFQAAVSLGTGGTLSWMYPPSLDSGTGIDGFYPRMFPSDTQVIPSYEVSVASQGSISLEVTPSVAFKVEVDLGGYIGTKALSTNSHMRADFTNQMVLGVGVADSSCDGLYYWIDYILGFRVVANASALGWTQDRGVWTSARGLKSRQCYAFSDDTGEARRSLNIRTDDDPSSANPLFPDPTGSHLACARDTTADGDGICPDWYDSEGNQINSCVSSSSSQAASLSRRDAELAENERWFIERSIEKRAGKAAIGLCRFVDSNGVESDILSIDQINFPSSGELITMFPNVLTYGADQPNTCSDFGMEHKWLDDPRFDLCEYMGFWWGQVPIIPTFTGTFYDSAQISGIIRIMAKTLGNSDTFVDELVLLYSDVNGMKEKAFGDYEDPLNIDGCLAANPPAYQFIMDGLRKEVFTIKYLQMVSNNFTAQAERVGNWLDGAEDDLARFSNQNYNVLPYVKQNFGNMWRKYVYEQSVIANAKLRGSLARIAEVAAKLDPQNNAAGGGTTTGATQVNRALLSLLEQIEHAYAGVGEWETPLNPAGANFVFA
ncbi:hypothetical protein LQW54_001871 [Pestalotiopsis sp. IQ-011]